MSYTGFKAEISSWSLFWITIQLKGCTSWSRTTTLQYGHVCLVQLLLHSPPGRKECKTTRGPVGVLTSQPWKEARRKYMRWQQYRAAELCSLLFGAYSFKMQPLAKCLMKVWWTAFCLTPATEPQPCRAALPQQNVTTQEDQETGLQEAGLQAAEQLNNLWEQGAPPHKLFGHWNMSRLL